MVGGAKFIWLNKEIYPFLQDSCVPVFSKDRKKYRFGVAAFKKSFEFDKKIIKAQRRFYTLVNIPKSKCVKIGSIMNRERNTAHRFLRVCTHLLLAKSVIRRLHIRSL